MELGQEFQIFGQSWAYINFVENPGMAFGLNFGGVVGKILLTLFRIIVVGAFFYIVHKMLRTKSTPLSMLISMALIIAGAMGNIVDSVFYGAIFSASQYHGGIAEFVPFGTGYAPLLQGKVVDMLYFPMYRGVLPTWVPIYGGEYFEFFRPVFNVADTAISSGLALFLITNRRKNNGRAQTTDQ